VNGNLFFEIQHWISFEQQKSILKRPMSTLRQGE